MRRLLILLVLLIAPAAQSADLTIFAAASLTDALRDIAPLWEAEGHSKLRFSFAASSTLARQLDQGAIAHLFASADQQWMDWADQHHLIVPDTRRTLLGNTLVLVMPRDRVHPVTIDSRLDLKSLLGADGRIATGDPSNVPAGIYAQQALTRLGLWATAEPRLARSDSVRSALLLVERGEAPLGIVYATDAVIAPNVAIAGTFPETSHDRITYPFAVPRSGDTPEARAFLDFLSTAKANAIFTQRGFLPVR